MPGARLGPGASVASIVRYRVFPDGYIQLGCATPSGERELDTAPFFLARRVAEPLLLMPDPDPARGWRMHFSALWGRSLRRGSGLLLGAGADIAAAFRATPDLKLNPADAISAQAAYAWTGPGWRGRARLHAARESAERGSGVVVRGGRMLTGFQLDGGWEASPVYLGAVLGVSRSGRCRVPHPETYGLWRSSGPGSLGSFTLTAEPRTRVGLGNGFHLRPSIEIAWRRILPEGLPHADGWASSTGVHVSIGDQARELALGFVWERGRWRAWEQDVIPRVETLRGWRIITALRAWRIAGPAPSGEGGG
jgi:hypothetical protein